MPQTDPHQLAKVAYAVYGDAVGQKNFRGDPLPEWDELTAPIQNAWAAAADAVQLTALKAPAGGA